MSYPSYFNPFDPHYSFRRPLPERDTISREQLATLIDLLKQFPLPVNRRVPVARPGRDVEAAQLLERAIRSGLVTDEYPPVITDRGLRLAELPPYAIAALPSQIRLDAWA